MVVICISFEITLSDFEYELCLVLEVAGNLITL